MPALAAEMNQGSENLVVAGLCGGNGEDSIASLYESFVKNKGVHIVGTLVPLVPTHLLSMYGQHGAAGEPSFILNLDENSVA